MPLPRFKTKVLPKCAQLFFQMVYMHFTVVKETVERMGFENFYRGEATSAQSGQYITNNTSVLNFF